MVWSRWRRKIHVAALQPQIELGQLAIQRANARKRHEQQNSTNRHASQVLLWRLQSPTRMRNCQSGLSGRFSEKLIRLFRLTAREKSCEKCDRQNRTYSRDFEISSIHPSSHSRRLGGRPATSAAAFQSDRQRGIRFVLRLRAFGLRQRLVPARFRRQGLPFGRHAGPAPASLAIFGQRAARFTLRTGICWAAFLLVDASGRSLQRVERRKRRAARELRSARILRLLLHLLFRYLAPPLPPVDVRPDRERRCSVAELRRFRKHRGRSNRRPASGFPTACSMPTPTIWRSLCCSESVLSCFFSTGRSRAARLAGVAGILLSTFYAFRTGSRGSVIAASAMLILIFWFSRNRWKVAAFGLAALLSAVLAASIGGESSSTLHRLSLS